MQDADALVNCALLYRYAAALLEYSYSTVPFQRERPGIAGSLVRCRPARPEDLARWISLKWTGLLRLRYTVQSSPGWYMSCTVQYSTVHAR
jgi:hypothetical protein